MIVLSCRWYGLYARGKTYTNARNSVKSSMIWGSQYDAMLNYALTGDDKDKVTSTGNGNNGGSEMNTGSTPKDKILNIFDLAGNHSEWTSEVYTEMYRTYRGGNYTRVCSPATRVTEEAPDNVGNTFSTRIALYICNNK